MKHYRLHDLLRLAALAFATSGCGAETPLSPGGPGGNDGGGGDAALTDAATDSGETVGETTSGDAIAGNDATGNDASGGDAKGSDATPKEDAVPGADGLADVPADGMNDAADVKSEVTDGGVDAADAAADGSPVDGGDATAKTPFPCLYPAPLVVKGADTGFVTCGNGMVARAKVLACQPYVADPNKTCAAGFGSCKTDADCATTPGGHCDQGLDSPCYCQSSCQTDSDCGVGQICQCGPLFGSCVQAACTSNADCSDGVCGYYVANPGCDFPAFACQNAADTCAVNADCKPGETCTWDKAVGHRFCSQAMCAIGRPFAVQGTWRVAETVARTDWSRKLPAPSASELSRAQRADVAAHWLAAAQMEHASVASFARLTLELLAVGAPPELLVRAQQAGLDEVRHAQTCFALAAAYGADVRGPGALATGGAVRPADLATLAADAAREGCVWETAAALEARVAAAECRDPEARRWLTQIADDEANHADLAWDLVRWALAGGDADVRGAVQVAIDEAVVALRAMPVGTAVPDGLGILGGERLRRLRGHAIDSVIEPSLRTLGLGVCDSMRFSTSALPF